MLALFRVFLQITIRRRGPEHLPDSSLLLSITVAASVVLDGISLWVTGLEPEQVIPVLVAATLFPVGFTAIVLVIGGHLERLRRTLTAVFGVSLVIETIYLPIRALSVQLTEAARAYADPTVTLAEDSLLSGVSFEALQTLGLLVLALQIAALVWRVAAYGWVFERAMEKDLLYGTAIAGTMLVIHTIVLTSL